MKMREWTEYFNSPVRGKVLNVISLEFSKTRYFSVFEIENLDCHRSENEYFGIVNFNPSERFSFEFYDV